jgi:serine/threonine protein kinase
MCHVHRSITLLHGKYYRFALQAMSGNRWIGDPGLENSSDAMTNAMCSTLYYTAPDVLDQQDYRGRKADIWSIRVLFYVMASRALPWHSADPAGFTAEIRRGPTPSRRNSRSRWRAFSPSTIPG